MVDRPLGSHHPKDPTHFYPVNYGELPGTVSGDGHPIDAYLLGWEQAVVEAFGQVIAVIIRADDNEDKLVVAREGTAWTADTIRQAVDFQERYFNATIEVWPG